jgi:hypothetical protein
MDIDLDRWQALLAAYANAVDASPPFMLLQEAQGRWSRANADLEDFKARGAVGRRDQRNPDIELSFNVASPNSSSESRRPSVRSSGSTLCSGSPAHGATRRGS